MPLLDLTREIAAKNQELIELYRKRDEHLAQVGPPWQIDTLGNRHGPDYYELRLERAIAQMRQQLSDLELQQRVLNQRLHEAREEMKNVRVFVLKERTECRPVYYKFDPRYLRCESTRDT